MEGSVLVAAGTKPTYHEPEAQWEATLAEQDDLPDSFEPELMPSAPSRKHHRATRLATISFEDAVARIPTSLREKLESQLRGTFREVISYERTEHALEQDAVTTEVADIADDDDEADD